MATTEKWVFSSTGSRRGNKKFLIFDNIFITFYCYFCWEKKFKTKFNIGSTLNIDSSYSIVKKTIQKRIKSGSNFFITQPLYSEKDFVLLSKLSKNKNYQILAGILPIKNKKTFVNLINKINGISKVNELFDLLSGANEKDFADISTKYLLNLLEKYKSELDGVHIMTSGDIRLASKIANKI